MKHIYTLIFIAVIFNFTSAQVDSNVIDINNIKTMVNADGRLFWNGNNPFYRFPKDSETSTIFAGNIWISAYDENNNLCVAASTYNVNGNDFQSGFIGSDEGELDKVWKISKSQIKALRRDFDDNSRVDSAIPTDILTYPAFGNPNVTGTLTGNSIPITVDYLPYEDRNQDGIYNVYDGDLPIINGDMQLIWLLNDDILHTQSYGTPLEFDIVGMMYANECSADGFVDNTIFIKYDLINRSNHTYDFFRFGMWTDADLGCHLDDHIGCSIPTNSFYFYNEKGTDGEGGCSGTPSYGKNVPIQSVTYLNQNLDNFTYYLNSGCGLGMSQPQNPQEFYYYLDGFWQDGIPLTYGGNGYGGTTPYNYVYFGNPADSGSISMAQHGVRSIDTRTIATTNLPLFQPNDKQTVEFAYITHADVPHPKPDIIPIENRIIQMQNLHDNDLMNWDVYLGVNQTVQAGQSVNLTANTDNQNPTYSYLWSTGETTKTIHVNTSNTYSVIVTNNETGCTKTDNVDIEVLAAAPTDSVTNIIYPNPANDVININFTDFDSPTLTIQISDMTGNLIKSTSINNTNIQQIDVSDLNSGLYIFDFKNEVGETLGRWKMMILD